MFGVDPDLDVDLRSVFHLQIRILSLPRERCCSGLMTYGILASVPWLAVWLSGNTLASINVVALRQTRLVLGWVTVCGRVNHFGM